MGMNSDRPPLRLLSVAFLLTFVIFSMFGYFSWSSYKNVKASMQQSVRIVELKGTILLYDEVLTMSAKMASASGDIYWEKRYEKFEPKLNLAIKQLISISPESFIGESAEKTDTANVKLVAMEKQAFKEVRKGNLDKAKALLGSEAYQREKKIYTAGMRQINKNIEVQTDELIKKQRRQIFLLILSLIVTLPLLIITWIVTYRKFILYIDERNQAEGRMEHLNRVLRAIRDVNQLITHETNRAALLRRSCEMLTSTRGYRSSWVALCDAEGSLVDMAASGIGEDIGAVREALEKGDSPECHLRAMEHADGIAVIHDTSVNCKACALKHTYRDTAALAGRLRHAGRDFGVLAVALPKEVADDEEEQSLFRELIGDVAYALHTMEIEQARKQDEAEREKLQAQLTQAQKMESVGRLAGGVAHDFNNMLGVILGHADMILEGMNPDNPFHDDLTEIKKAGERSAHLTRQLLAFARKQTVAPEVIDLNQIVEDMLAMLHRLIGEDIDMVWIPGEAV